jgi:BON domain
MKTETIQPHGFRPDQELVTAVLQALRRNRFIPANTIQIGLTQGWVTLMGEVDCASQRQLAEATVRAVDGVKGVTNRIAIKPRVPQVYVVSAFPSGDAAFTSHLPSYASSSCKICRAARHHTLEPRSEPQSQTGSDPNLQLEE